MSKHKFWPLLALAGAVAALAGALLLLSRPDDAGQAGIALCPLQAQAADSLCYEQDGETIRLQKNSEDVWYLADDTALPLDQQVIATMLEGICGLQATHALDAAGIDGDTGFEAPELTLQLTAGEQSFSLTVGALNPVSQIYYARTAGEEQVYTVDSASISGLCHSRRGLYAGESPVGLDPADLTEMTVDNGLETLHLACEEGTWYLAEEPETSIDQTTAARMANTACNLKTVWAITTPGPEEEYGMDAPTTAVTLTDGAGQSVALRFGAMRPGETETDAGTCYLAVSTAPGTVYEVDLEHLSAFAYTRATLLAQQDSAGGTGTAAALPEGESAESRLQTMTLEQKVGQLFLVRPDSLDTTQTQQQINDAHAVGVTAVSDAMREMLRQYPVGGVALFGKNIEDEAQLRALIGDLQAASDTPLFVAVDEEGGAIARLANSKAFDLPLYESAAAVGAQGESAALEMGRTIGGYLKGYGLNVDFAPVADVDLNPQNPVIGTRAFSGDAATVKVLAAAMGQGLQEQGVLPVFKHFPGHGDTAEDSHYDLAVLDKTQEQLAAAEWLPYGWEDEPPLEQGSYAVMVGHIAVPAIGGEGVPATFSSELVRGILKQRLHDPLVITDSLAMEAIARQYEPGEAAVKALQAGCDILLMPNGLAEAYSGVLDAVQNGTLTEQRLEESVLKILQYKERYGIL